MKQQMVVDWDWPTGSPEMLARYVIAHNIATDKIVLSAQNQWAENSEEKTFDILLDSMKPDTERQVLAALYQYLSDKCSIESQLPCYSDGHQRIMSPQRIMERGKATCLDLSLLFAGCMENLRLCPLVILVGNQEETPSHAIAACWRGTQPGGKPIRREKSSILTLLEKKQIYAVESTGIAITNAEKCKLSFEEAETLAFENINSAKWICAIDIANIREKILPLETQFEPEVIEAFQIARQFAIEKKLDRIPSAFLFCAIMETWGDRIQKFCEHYRIDKDSFINKVQNAYPEGDFSGEPMETQKIRLCRVEMKWICKSLQLHTIRESELIYALCTSLDKPTRAFFKKAGINISNLLRYLEKHYPYKKLDLQSFKLLHMND